MDAQQTKIDPIKSRSTNSISKWIASSTALRLFELFANYDYCPFAQQLYRSVQSVPLAHHNKKKSITLSGIESVRQQRSAGKLAKQNISKTLK